VRQLLFITAICALSFGFFSSRPSYSREMDKESDGAQQAYRAYVKAWKLKDIPALEEIISDDYMVVTSRAK
jgi:predicted lipid-binding transport protein (Tim44 family)